MNKDNYSSLHDKCSGLPEILSLHLHYNGKPVNCSITRSFLPTFLVESMRITVPTPITVHLDNCEQCRETLAIIKFLDLEDNHLRQLSMLFSYNLANNRISCSEAEAYIGNFVDLDWNGINTETLKHLSTCPDCQKKIYKTRQNKISDYRTGFDSSESLPCRSISFDDIFDYCYPFSTNSANDQHVKFNCDFIAHVRNCPDCLFKMQNLHRIISAIVLQPDSGILTKYNILESIESKAENGYSGFPVEVEISKQKEDEKTEQKIPIGSANTLRKWFSKSRLKTLTQIAAAAVIILAVGLFFVNLPSASAITIEKVYDAIAAINSVHIKSFIAGDDKPTQEKWVSRSLGLYMTKTGEDLVLRDVNNAVEKLKKGSFSSIIEAQLKPADSIELKQRIKSSFGLVPFEKTSTIPEDHTWEQLYLEGLGENIEVYELSWNQKSYTGGSHYKKWRVFLNKTTHLPQKIEYYEKIEGLPDDYELVEIKEVSYLDDAEMKSLINVYF